MSLTNPGAPSVKSALPALLIFAVCVVTRAVLQLAGGESVGDVSWITTFGAIGASWVGITGQVSGLSTRMESVERNTNGKLTDKFGSTISEAAELAATRAVEKHVAANVGLPSSEAATAGVRPPDALD